MGYRTLFAYLKEMEKGTISKDTVDRHLAMQINCGQFSYAEIPKLFGCILGVTGTLQTLGNFEKEVMQKEYQIAKSTFTPSIYGPSNLVFKEKDDVFVEMDQTRHYQKILDEILQKKNLKRAVLVFFESDEALKQFLNSPYRPNELAVIDFSERQENIDFYIKKSMRCGQVAFLPREFGRGLDFVCRDDAVDEAGGVHVIQTFLSEELSEEIQIRGRTARQGKKGSYTLILSALDLQKTFSLASVEEIEEMRKSANLYGRLNEKRIAHFEKTSSERKGIVARSLELHKESLEYQDAFKTSPANEDKMLQFLLKQNK